MNDVTRTSLTLLPCPFCGDQPELRYIGIASPASQITCGCGAAMYGEDQEEATERWRRRTSSHEPCALPESFPAISDECLRDLLEDVDGKVMGSALLELQMRRKTEESYWRSGCECNRVGLCYRCQAAAVIERLQRELDEANAMCTKLANEALAAASQPPGDGWIAVTERLPAWSDDRREHVCVYSDTHDWCGTQFAVMRQADFYHHDDTDDIGTADSKVVTHWKPLVAPAPTKGEGQS